MNPPPNKRHPPGTRNHSPVLSVSSLTSWGHAYLFHVFSAPAGARFMQSRREHKPWSCSVVMSRMAETVCLRPTPADDRGTLCTATQGGFALRIDHSTVAFLRHMIYPRPLLFHHASGKTEYNGADASARRRTAQQRREYSNTCSDPSAFVFLTRHDMTQSEPRNARRPPPSPPPPPPPHPPTRPQFALLPRQVAASHQHATTKPHPCPTSQASCFPLLRTETTTKGTPAGQRICPTFEPPTRTKLASRRHQLYVVQWQ